MKFKFSKEKNDQLIAERNISFEELIEAISNADHLLIESHPNQEKYSHQEVIYVRLREEVYVIPFVAEDDGTYFLKTAFPSRKARKKFLENRNN